MPAHSTKVIPNLQPLNLQTEKKKKKVESRKLKEREFGKLKFFDMGKKYGFIVNESDNSDMFVHFDDLKKAQVSSDLLANFKNKYELSFSFLVFEYQNKSGKVSRKAVDIKLLNVKELAQEKTKPATDQS